MKRLITVVFLFLFCFNVRPALAQVPIGYYLPEGVTYDPSIPTPESFLGFQIGEWHISHDKLVFYLEELASKSPRITLQEYARSYEQRPLLLLTITSPENHKNINAIRDEHVKLANPAVSSGLDINKMPVVIYQGFSVHGNEPSGANSVPLVVYHLAAAQGKEIDNLLQNSVILLDPCFNPDGFNRFANWANVHKSQNVNPDPATREHNEVWPGGRTNHYWFDLNRDWLPVQHPESQGRIANFQAWKPNILTDHHEMSTNATFFFQPGIPSRTNPLTPQKNQDLTKQIGEYHAKALDKIGSLYYSEESYDDFYYGKGSTYPDVNGGIGILFEQASSRGHAQNSVNGLLEFPFTIRNQFLTALSTLEAGIAMRTDLLGFQREFYQTGVKEASAGKMKAVVFGDDFDAAKLFHFVEIVLKHDIQVYPVVKPISAGGKVYSPGHAYVIPYGQPQYRLIKAMFEKRTTFRDSLFYDISAWTFPLAFDLNFAEIPNLTGAAEKPINQPAVYTGQVVGVPAPYAYLMEWYPYYAPKVAFELLKKELVVKVANQDFDVNFNNGTKSFSRGTILIPATQQKMDPATLAKMLDQLSREQGVEIFALGSGATKKGIDLGSPSFSPLKDPKLLILVGEGVSGYDAGEVWHLLDDRFGIDLTIVDVNDFGRLNMNDYETLVLVSGSFGAISKAGTDKLRDWISEGGTVIGMKNAIRWLESSGLANVKFKSDQKNLSNRPYALLDEDSGSQVIGGAIFETKLDMTHPLSYGYPDANLPIFRSGTLFMEPSSNAYATPVRYTSNPLMAGYISDHNLKLAQNSAEVIVSRQGRGKVICIAGNPNFRAFWYGTTKLFMNAIFFGHTISGQAAEMPQKKEEKNPASEFEEHHH